jgi:hypothetical protein
MPAIAHAVSAVRVADWLCLAATPAFAAMAALTVMFGDDMPLVCSAAPFPLNGMVPMYVLMSLFHASPWLKLLARKRS